MTGLEIIGAVNAAIALCSVIAAITPGKSDDARIGKIGKAWDGFRTIIDLGAFNFLNAKNERRR